MSEADQPHIEIHAEADDFHQAGVTIAARSGDYGLAQLMFTEAHLRLSRVARQPSADELSLEVQRTRVYRDSYFTLARAALRDHRPEFIDEAYQGLFRGSVKSLGIVYALSRQRLSLAESRYVESEAAASLGLLGRVATLACVVGGTGNPMLEHPESAETFYSRADAMAKTGGNTYYATSNAMCAARDARIHNRKGKAMGWVKKAAGYTAHSFVADRPNAAAAVRTFGRRLLDLRSSKHARSSVLVRP